MTQEVPSSLRQQRQHQLRSPLGKTQQWQKRQNCDYRAVGMSFFFKAFNTAAAAATMIECANLWRQLEEERELVQRLKQVVQRLTEDVQRLKQEKEDEAEMAQKDVEYATARADVAENEWIKLKRELREARELVQLLNPEGEETRQIVLRQGDDKELELLLLNTANALNTASVAESECDKLRTLLEEERQLVHRLIVEKEDEAQLGKRQIEEIGQELTDARKDAEYATARANAAESKCAILERILIEEGKTIQRLVSEKDNEAEQAKREIEKMGRELACAADIVQHECAKLKRLLEEEKKLARRLILEKDDEVQLAKRQIEEIDKELAHARKDAELAQKDADAVEKEWTKVRRHVKEKEELIKFLNLEILDIRQVTVRQVGEIISQELEEARNNAEHAQYDDDIAQGECAKLKRLLEEEKKLARRLILEKDDEVQLAKRQIEEIDQELAHARKDAELARKDAESECANLERMLIEEGKTVQRLIIEKDDKAERAKRTLEKMGRKLACARSDADIAKNDLQEKLELIQILNRECEETSERAMRQVEEKELELADILKSVTSASSSSSVAKDCAICLTNENDLAFGCGHMTCKECGKTLSNCPICRKRITIRIKLFP